MLNNKSETAKKKSGKKEIPKGPNYLAKVKFYDCKASSECIKACPEKAIEEGPKRLPAAVCISEGKYEMLPGKAVTIRMVWHKILRLAWVINFFRNKLTIQATGSG